MSKLESDDLLSERYRISHLIGEGSMGSVYAADHIHIGRKVAIKVLHAKYNDDDAMVERFMRESQAAAMIGSRHIVEVLDVGQVASGQRFIVMERLAGESLRTRMRRRATLAAGELFPLMVQLLDGLHAAHGAGILHRDIKPDNVFITPDEHGNDFVKLLDFGISKFRFDGVDCGSELTATGMVMGTPHYMAPEQALGETAIDRRADLFAVGAVMFKALSGEYAFTASSPSKLLFKTALTSARSLASVMPDVDPGIAAIVDRALLRDPELRFDQATSMANAMADWLRENGTGLSDAEAWFERAPPALLAPASTTDEATVIEALDKLELSELGDELEARDPTKMTAVTHASFEQPSRWPIVVTVGAGLVLAGVGLSMFGTETQQAVRPVAPSLATATAMPSAAPSATPSTLAATPSTLAATPSATPSTPAVPATSTSAPPLDPRQRAAPPRSRPRAAVRPAPETTPKPETKTKAPRTSDDRPFRNDL